MKRDPIQGFFVQGIDDGKIAVARTWKLALVALAVSIALIVVCYRSTGAIMAATWLRSETFAHGFIVVPVSLWLMWRSRSEVLATEARPAWWVPALMFAVGFAWLLGEVGTINALSQFAFVALIVLAVPAVLGFDVARRLAFPLGFLFFAVPVGEFMMPQLMEWTADVTVKAIELTGIPVFREGQNFVIPTGRWSVVEACSGVRYLIASLVIGTLYAYLTYRSTGRRILFVGFSIAVPIVANWIRAYMIVMLGHLSGNRIAVGVDHLIYGWIFFGVVVLIMFWLGSRFGEPEPIVAPAPRTSAWRVTAASPTEFVGITLMVAIAVVAWPLLDLQIERDGNRPEPVLSPIAGTGGWSAMQGSFTSWQPSFANPSARLQQEFRRGAATVGVHISYYRNQNHERKLVSSDNAIVRSDDPTWLRVGHGVTPLVWGDQRIDAPTEQLQSKAGDRLVVWRWYWIDGRLTGSDVVAKARIALTRLMGRGDDAAIIVVYTPRAPAGAADDALAEFVRDMAPGISAELQRVRENR